MEVSRKNLTYLIANALAKHFDNPYPQEYMFDANAIVEMLMYYKDKDLSLFIEDLYSQMSGWYGVEVEAPDGELFHKLQERWSSLHGDTRRD